jgi:hypothetical protein
MALQIGEWLFKYEVAELPRRLPPAQIFVVVFCGRRLNACEAAAWSMLSIKKAYRD